MKGEELRGRSVGRKEVPTLSKYKDIQNIRLNLENNYIITSDSIQIKPYIIVKHYCVLFDFYCIRHYNRVV